MNSRSAVLPSRARAVAWAAFVLGTSSVFAADWPQWRGPNRDGISSETGLLAAWPQGGPRLAWKSDAAGAGYSTPSVVGQRIYLLGNEGLDDEFVAALSLENGQRLWRTRLGKVGNPDQKPPFPAARSTPTYEAGVLYVLGSDGDMAAVEAETGKVRWHKNARADFGGKPGVWAYSESPLVDGDRVIYTPGGSTATVVALNKTTGDVVWKAALPEGDDAGYASAVVVEAAGVRQYVQLVSKGLVGLDASTGKFLWRHGRAVSRYGANIPTPVVSGNVVYFGTAGTGGGAVRLVAKDGGVAAEEAYFEAKLPTAIGGAVKVGNHLYGTTAQALLCVDFATGKILWEERALGAASLCFADGRLYLHGENGDVALVEPSAEGYREKGRFTPPEGPKPSGPMEKTWAYPVVSHGKLLVRAHATVWCYDVR
ncbi:MAG: PQQ-like beta-propeller repeat protein [Verrucomicrobiales bacterium]|nr:PQQ-like beta-propeller repeat protein [Verrucomicrobiales bacterium]